jgi:hypothetical protein
MDLVRYRVSKLPKGGGKIRTIYIPTKDYKHKLRSFLPRLYKIATELDTNNVCHAFIKGRNCVTNAMQHIDYRYTISLDIKDFFDSIGIEHISSKIPDDILSYSLINGVPRQGLPTSPLISNIALSDIDNQIINSLKFFGTPFSYTRYADDLTISLDNKKAIQKVIYAIRTILSQQGFVVNEQKTRIQYATNGRRIITGVGVDESSVHPTRKTLKSIRAALHKGKWSSARGLLEWSFCKLPGQRRLKVPELYRYAVSRKKIQCDYCGQDGLQWHTQYINRFILVHTGSNKQHICPSRDQPINKMDLDRKLRGMDFKAVVMSSKAWAKGLYKASSNETLLILFRKRGIDICLYPYATQFLSTDAPHTINDGLLYYISYDSNLENVHAMVLKIAGHLLSGQAIDRTILDSYGTTNSFSRFYEIEAPSIIDLVSIEDPEDDILF